MEEKIVEEILEEMMKRPELSKFNKKHFVFGLTKANVPEPSRFYENMENGMDLFKENGYIHFLTLQRVLRNKLQLKKTYDVVSDFLQIYFSDKLNRSLRTNKNLIKIMEKCEKPFSLLGELQSFDVNCVGDYIRTKPILVIPQATNLKVISDWEEANTTYELDFAGHCKKIKPSEYLSRKRDSPKKNSVDEWKMPRIVEDKWGDLRLTF